MLAFFRQGGFGVGALAARKADHCGSMGGRGRRNRQVLDESIKRLREPAVAVQEIEDLIEEEKNRHSRRLENSTDRFRSRRGALRRAAQRFDTSVAHKLSGHVDPWRLAALPWIPGVSYKDSHSCFGDRRKPRSTQQVRNSGELGRSFSADGEVIEGCQGVRLPAAELGDEGEDRRGVFGLAREPAEDHADVLAQRPGETCTGEELRRLPVVFGRGPGNDLLESDGELIRIEGTSFPDLLSWRCHFVPGLH
jgi:hypothetical protein